jgi:hypothetical protein
MNKDSKAFRIAILIVLGLFILAIIAGQYPTLFSNILIIFGFFGLGYFIGVLVWSLLIEPKLRK